MMQDNVYHKLAEVLNTLPNGFPSTENGVEIKILKSIFTPEQAELFCQLRLTFETPEQIAARIGRPLEGLSAKLDEMAKNGQLFKINFGDVNVYRMLPWVFGIYEFQLSRLDKAMAELCKEYMPVYSQQFFSQTPQLMQTLPVEKTITATQQVLPYERVSTIIENGQSFLVNECICKKEKKLLGHPCDRPLEVCLAIAPVPGVFDKSPNGRTLTKQAAYELLEKTEELGLVHLTSNVQNGHYYICNCCKCCCGVLDAINTLGLPASTVINSHYYAAIDPDKCIQCGLCADERCQVEAIAEDGDGYHVDAKRCIGCGLCISTCPEDAIALVRKPESEIEQPPMIEEEWYKERGRRRGVDFSPYA